LPGPSTLSPQPSTLTVKGVTVATPTSDCFAEPPLARMPPSALRTRPNLSPLFSFQ
jgi:hypothetical protein